MPDHIHSIWTLPPGDTDYSGRWRAIKARFSRTLARDGVPLGRNRRGEYDLWQRRSWELASEEMVEIGERRAGATGDESGAGAPR